MKHIFIILMIITFPFYVFSHEIQLKDGRRLNVENYWEQDGQIVCELFGATIYLDKNEIKKIIREGEDEFAQKQAEQKNQREILERKYNTNGAVVLLKNGKTILANKSWFEDGLIYCETGNQKYYFLEKDIMQFSKSKIKTNNLKTFQTNNQQKQHVSRNNAEPPSFNFVKDGLSYDHIRTDIIPISAYGSKKRKIKIYMLENRECRFWVEGKGWETLHGAIPTEIFDIMKDFQKRYGACKFR